MIRLEKRPTPSRLWTAVTPLIAVALTMVVGGVLFAFLGADPLEAIRTIFWDPLFHPQFAGYSRPQLLVLYPTSINVQQLVRIAKNFCSFFS